jgi:predicted flap endonuclease-1-like 5' DNA nuclease
MLMFIDFCTCHWLLPWLLSGLLGIVLGYLLGLGRGKKETFIEEKIVYKDKIVYQDKIIYKESPSKGEAAQIVSSGGAQNEKVNQGSKSPTTADKKKDKEDDYLSCNEYEGKEINDKENNVAMFKHDGDGQFYFAIYNPDNSVKIRSEGFKTAKERDQELSGVLKFHEDEAMYKTLTRGRYSMKVLYDASGREVGRSCLITKETKAAPKSKSSTKPKASESNSESADLFSGAVAKGKKPSIYSKLKNDNLQIVEGIGPNMDEVLKKYNINTWKELASNSPEDLRAILDKENPTRYRIIDPTTWPEQARLANTDDWEGLIKYQKRLDTGRIDVGDGATDAKVEKLLIKMGLLKKWKKDDLKAIEGIGPKIEGLLKDAGMNTWEKLSKTSVKDIQAVLDEAGPRYKLADPGSWPKQAEFAFHGRWDDLQEYQDFLVGGR